LSFIGFVDHCATNIKVLTLVSDVKSKLAQELVRLRGTRSLYEVSMGMGLHRATLLRYEQGRKVPEDHNLQLLAQFYEVSFESLKMLIFTDQFPESSRDRQILIQWLRELERQK
jgi:transcriptional regulator with XRE-family HTH domain